MKSYIDYITTFCNYQYLDGDNNHLLFKKIIDQLEINLQIDASLFQISIWIDFNNEEHKKTTHFTSIDESFISHLEHKLLDEVFCITHEEIE